MNLSLFLDELSSGTGCSARAVVIAASGSTPQKVGSTMVLRADGSPAGTIGGLVATVLMLERLGVIHLPRRGGAEQPDGVGVTRADLDAISSRVEAAAAASATVAEMPTRLAVVEAQLSALQERHDDLRHTTRDALRDAREEMRRAVERARTAAGQ